MNIPIIRRQQQIIKKIVEHIGTDQEFLEIGCGEGHNLDFFSSLGLKGIGVDISEKALKIARSKKIKNVKIIKGDFMKKNFAPKNLVFLLFVLEHIKDDKRFIKKISNLIKNKGYFVLSVPAHSKSYSFQDRLAGHYRRYDRKEIEKLLFSSGVKTLEIYSIGFPVSNLYNWIYNLYLQILKKGRKINEHNTKITGISSYRKHFPFLARVSSFLFFPILIILLKLDFCFQKSDFGTHYIILAQKQ